MIIDIIQNWNQKMKSLLLPPHGGLALPIIIGMARVSRWKSGRSPVEKFVLNYYLGV